MIALAISWLGRRWWGLLIAYPIAVLISYTGLWALLEPCDIPRQFETLWPPLMYRATYHIAASFLLGAHLTLLLELLVRKAHWAIRGESSARLPFDKGYDVGDSKDFYDAIAAEYDQRNSPSLLRTHEQVIGLVKEAISGRTNSTVLDLGGGTGKLIAHHFFDRSDIHWVYVDNSALMVEQFRKNLADTKLAKTIQVEEIDTYVRRSPQQRCDIIILSLVLTSMGRNPDWGHLVARLADTGRLIIAEIDAAYTATHPYYIVKSGQVRHALRPRPVPLTQLVHEAEAAGLTLLHVHPISEGNAHYAFVAEFTRS